MASLLADLGGERPISPIEAGGLYNNSGSDGEKGLVLHC